MKLSIKKGSENYAAQVIELPPKIPVPGLDNLVQVTFQGNNCLVQKSAPDNQKYLFIPAGAVLDAEFIANNNLYRHSQKNIDTAKSGFIEDSGRVKALKFKGVISTGLIVPLKSIGFLADPQLLNTGDSFTDIDNKPICYKYTLRKGGFKSGDKLPKFDIEKVIESKFAPEHTDTDQLLKIKYASRFSLKSNICITHKLHGTSIRVFHTRTKRKLRLMDKIARVFGIEVADHEFGYIVGSRRVIKSKNFGALNNAKYFKKDLWTQVAQQYLKGKLNQGEAIYAEVIGMDYAGAPIQQEYTYGYTSPNLFIYRITQINDGGVEVDLSWEQVKQRAAQIGVKTVPEFYFGPIDLLMEKYNVTVKENKEGPDIITAFETLFHQHLLDKPSVLNRQVIEEGFVVRQETYPKVTAYKVKSRKFMLYESIQQDKEIADVEDAN